MDRADYMILGLFCSSAWFYSLTTMMDNIIERDWIGAAISAGVAIFAFIYTIKAIRKAISE